MLFSRHLENKENSTENLERLLKLCLSGMLTLFDTQFYARVVSRNVLKDVLLFFVNTLNEKVWKGIFKWSFGPVSLANLLISAL